MKLKPKLAITEKFSGIYKKFAFGIFSTVAISLSATLFTSPILAKSFNYFSLISPVANTLLTPFITLVFSLGVIVVALGFVCFPLAKGVAFAVNAFIGLIMNIIKANL